jgi:hypothetical protein
VLFDLNHGFYRRRQARCALQGTRNVRGGSAESVRGMGVKGLVEGGGCTDTTSLGNQDKKGGKVEFLQLFGRGRRINMECDLDRQAAAKAVHSTHHVEVARFAHPGAVATPAADIARRASEPATVVKKQGVLVLWHVHWCSGLRTHTGRATTRIKAGNQPQSTQSKRQIRHYCLGKPYGRAKHRARGEGMPTCQVTSARGAHVPWQSTSHKYPAHVNMATHPHPSAHTISGKLAG